MNLPFQLETSYLEVVYYHIVVTVETMTDKGKRNNTEINFSQL